MGENVTIIHLETENRPPLLGWNPPPPVFRGRTRGRNVFCSYSHRPRHSLILCVWLIVDDKKFLNLSGSITVQRVGCQLTRSDPYSLIIPLFFHATYKQPPSFRNPPSRLKMVPGRTQRRQKRVFPGQDESSIPVLISLQWDFTQWWLLATNGYRISESFFL